MIYVRPVIAQCCMEELYLQGSALQPAVELAKTFERRKCNHREGIPGDECLLSVVGDTNKHRYVIASQSNELRQKLRSVPGVPLVHINRSVTVLEPPSAATLKQKDKTEESRQHANVPETELIANITAGPSDETQQPPASEPIVRKRKAPKGPNPLSIRKRKTQHPGPRTDASKTAQKPQRGKRTLTTGGNADNDHEENDQAERLGHKRKRRRKNTSGEGEGINVLDAASS